MTNAATPSWRTQQLINVLHTCWLNLRGVSSSARTKAITDCFLNTLGDPNLSQFRPDAIWTALQNVYYLEESRPALASFNAGGSPINLIESLSSIRQGWVRSSGVALEEAYERLYNPILSTLSPRVDLVRKAQMRTHPSGRRAVNLGVDDIGTAREDDAYLLTVNAQGRVHVFGVVQFKVSVGDRADQGGRRSAELMQRGYWSIVFTLDPMEVARSQRGMLVHPSYIATINGTQGRLNMWHYVYIARNSSLHRVANSGVYSRIKDVNIRQQPDDFVNDASHASHDWLAAGHSIPITWT